MALLVLKSWKDASLLSSPKAKSVLLLYSSDHPAHNIVPPSNVPFINSTHFVLLPTAWKSTIKHSKASRRQLSERK